MPPRSSAENEAVREQTRAYLMEHALRLFARHGYAATSVRMIAESAGVAQGLLYRYFDGKESLLLALLHESMRDVLATFGDADAEPQPAARLERLVRSAIAQVAEHREFWRLAYGLRMQPAVVEGLGRALRDWRATMHRALERYLREVGSAEPALDADLLFAAIDGVCQLTVLAPSRYRGDELARALVACFTGAASGRAR